MQGNRAGWQTVEMQSDGRVRAEFTYNDRNHGDHIIARWKLDAAGVPVEYEAHGVDYMKSSVQEQFEMHGGKARWKSRRENGRTDLTQSAFYMPANPPPEFYGVLVRALLNAPDRQLRLLPSGSATLELAGSLVMGQTGGRTEWFHYSVT